MSMIETRDAFDHVAKDSWNDWETIEIYQVFYFSLRSAQALCSELQRGAKSASSS
jgi:hypothetical protein